MKLLRYELRFEDAMLKLHRSALAGISHGFALEEEERDLHQVDAVYLRGGGEFLLGFVEDRLVAMGGFKVLGGAIAEVKRVRILPELQGQGIGTLLIGRLEAIGREKGIKKFVLDSAASRPKTLRFWLKHGYSQTGETVYGTQPTVCFEKRLGKETNEVPQHVGDSFPSVDGTRTSSTPFSRGTCDAFLGEAERLDE